VVAEHSIHNNVRVRTPSRMVLLPWQSAQDVLAWALAPIPRSIPSSSYSCVGVSRDVELLDPDDRTFCLAVIEAWSAQIREDELPPNPGTSRRAPR
jgi:hypothetical protein